MNKRHHLSLGAFVGSFFLYMVAAFAAPITAQAAWEDISDQMGIVVSTPQRSRRSPNATVTVTITHNAGDNIGAPARLVFKNLQPAAISIAGATPTTDGDPAIALDPSSATSFQITLPVTVNNGGRYSFGFDPAVELDIVDTGNQDNDGDGFTPIDGDCDDSNSEVHPDATDIPNNGIDEDCSGEDAVDATLLDADGDGFTPAQGDCNDSDAAINPDATDIPNNGVDENCDGADTVDTTLLDTDSDGFTPAEGDCDDSNGAINPLATDIPNNGIDEDCDGADAEDLSTLDTDGDGFTPAEGDCDDANPDLNPDATDIPNNGIDENCDGADTIDPTTIDGDGDGFTPADGDCDDDNAAINPGATDIPNNGIDEDCDGADTVDPSLLDVDGDGFTTGEGDCDDNDAAINPDATDVPNNGIDEDCDGADSVDDSLLDNDEDGFTPAAGDCDDTDPAINPDATDIPDNGIDENCDGDDATNIPDFTVHITSPASLTTFGASPVTVSGTVSDPAVSLTINGNAVVHLNGIFGTDVELTEGHNTIVARAVKGEQQITDSISVSLDLTPPFVTIESHSDGDDVFTDTITVTGLINDIVRGTIEEDQATVTVNGINASISNRSYAVTDVPLQEGSNTITATGTDQVGNTSNTTINVNYVVPVGRRIDLTGGQNQSGAIKTVLPEALEVQVLDDALNPVDGASVVFRVIQGSGGVAANTTLEGRAVVMTTDTEGKAKTTFKLGERVGTANQKVRAQVVGYDNEVIFNASATGNIGNKISINSGNNQRGSVGQTLAQPLVVVVTDDGANVVNGARVKFDVNRGGGKLTGGATTYETTTDSDGRATAEYTVGGIAGIDQQRVTATLLDGPVINGEVVLLNAGFTATAFIPADPGLTRISGVVLDNQDTPIPGVTIRVDGSQRQAVTGSAGRFLIEQAPVGPVHLIADGSTAEVEGEFPSLSYNIVTIAGVNNSLPAPIYMVKLDTDAAVYAGLEDVILELPKFPGFALEIAKDSVTFPDGAREGFISATAVNADKVPMAPPNGMQPQFIVTIQPTGAKFDPPARLSLPNVDGHPPGAQVEMYSFDHDLEEFVSIGLGSVSEDGALVSSNPGVGIIKAGWHCGSQPGGQGCAHNCPTCQDCDGNCNCVNKDNDPRLKECQSCKDGKVEEPTPESCCKEKPATDGFATAGGLVVCCAGKPTSCVAPGGDGSTGSNIIDKCIAEHEDAHHHHIECPDGDDKCETTRPPFKPSQDAGQGECDASKVEIACLNRERPNCGTDAACKTRVDNRIQQMINYGNTNKPGCI